MKTAQQIERIYRIWSSHRGDELAVRVQYSIEETGPSRLFVLGAREEWM
jgi:hypothetical protein